MSQRFQITFPNGDFRNLNCTFLELLKDLRYMRKKWGSLTVVISSVKIWDGGLSHSTQSKTILL